MTFWKQHVLFYYLYNLEHIPCQLVELFLVYAGSIFLPRRRYIVIINVDCNGRATYTSEIVENNMSAMLGWHLFILKV